MQLQLDPRLDPREWKKEHKVALVGAIALGCVIGLVFGSAHVNWDYVRVNLWYEISNMYLTDRGVLSVLSVLLWTLFGGVVAGSVVYITQLLRK